MSFNLPLVQSKGILPRKSFYLQQLIDSTYNTHFVGFVELKGFSLQKHLMWFLHSRKGALQSNKMPMKILLPPARQ